MEVVVRWGVSKFGIWGFERPVNRIRSHDEKWEGVGVWGGGWGLVS